MFERFTPSALEVVALAEEEAASLGHGHVSTEHILLGLLRVTDGVTAGVLASQGVTLERVRPRVVGVDDQGEGRVAHGSVPFTPRAGVVHELALREALWLGHNYISAEHLLLAAVREDECAATRMLLDFDTDLEGIREEVTRRLPDGGPTWEEILREIRTRYGLAGQ